MNARQRQILISAGRVDSDGNPKVTRAAEIAMLMSDGRERTALDIIKALNAPETTIRQVMTRLTAMGVLKSRRWSNGPAIYSKPDALEAAE